MKCPLRGHEVQQLHEASGTRTLSETPNIHMPQAYFMRQRRSSFFMLKERFISKNKSTCFCKCSYFWRHVLHLNRMSKSLCRSIRDRHPLFSSLLYIKNRSANRFFSNFALLNKRIFS